MLILMTRELQHLISEDRWLGYLVWGISGTPQDGSDFCPQGGGHRLTHMAQMLRKCLNGHGSQSTWHPGYAGHLAFHWCALLA